MTTAPPAAIADGKISQLQIDDEAMRRIVFGLARECYDFALARDIPSLSIEDQLPLVAGILDSYPRRLVDIRSVPATGATSFAALTIRFSDEGYRFLAQAAKDRMLDIVDGDRNA